MAGSATATVSAEAPIIGNVVCNGPWEILCSIEGELGEGAEVVGNVIAQEVTVRGRIKGTIRAARVKLQASGAVEGDIFHRSLSIEDTALFEGPSRRVENPIEAPKPAPRSQLATAEGAA